MKIMLSTIFIVTIVEFEYQGPVVDVVVVEWSRPVAVICDN